MERGYYANEQYLRRKCLDISSIPASFNDGDLESKVLDILKEINASVDPSLIEGCHRLPSQGSSNNKTIIKL